MANSLKLLVKNVQINPLGDKKIYSSLVSEVYKYKSIFFIGGYKNEKGDKLPSSVLDLYRNGITENLVYDGDLFKARPLNGRALFERHANLTSLLELCLQESSVKAALPSYLFKLNFFNGKIVSEEDLIPGWGRNVQSIKGITEFKIPFESYPFTLRIEDRAWNDIGQKFKLLDICENSVPLFHLGEILLEK